MSIRNKAILSVMIIITGLASIFYYLFFTGYKHAHDKNIQYLSEQLDKCLNNEIDLLQKAFLPRIKAFIKLHPDIIDAFKQQDRELLYKLTLPKFNVLKEANDFLFGFTYILPDYTVLLRMQKPEFFGDNVGNIPFAQYVFKNKKISIGFAITKIGAFYRIVAPVYENKIHIGLIGWAFDVSLLAQHIQQDDKISYGIFVNSKRYKILAHKESHPIEVQDHVLIATSSDTDIFKKLPSDFNCHEKHQIFSVDDKTFIISGSQLQNFTNEHMGDILLARDITAETVLFRKQIINTAVVTLILLTLSFLILYSSFGAMINKIEQLNKSLEKRVEKRTKELSEANAELIKEIKEKKQTRDVLQFERNRLKSILNAIPDGIYIVSQQYNIEYINPTLQRELGPVENRKCYKYLHNLSKICPWCKNAEVLAGKSVQWEWYSSKNHRYYDLFDMPFKNINGSISKLEISHDITERKKMEEEVLRTRKLESIGVLAGGIAHDFNNLLFAVSGNISLARNDLKLEAGSCEELEEAEKACIKAKELTARLITFSKGGDPVREICSIMGLLKDAIASTLKGTGIEYEFFIDDDIRKVNIDKYQIRQVIYNIIVNAKEAMNDRGQLKITCSNVDIKQKANQILAQGKYIKITIKDQGSGISNENLNKIFDPYVSTKEMGINRGQGLGLTVSYSIVKKHNGLITVESELEKGSSFSIYLPAATFSKTTPESIHKPDRKVISQESLKSPVTGKCKVLLMDDEEMVRNFLGQTLSRLGYNVETCMEGNKAIEIYTQAMKLKDPFNVAILDLTNKLGMGGQETMKRLIEIDPYVKGIVITGYFDDPVVNNYKAHGFSGFLAKPSTIEELQKVINDVLLKNQSD